MIRKKGYEMKDYAAWLKAWETYNLHFYSVPAWLSLALVLDLIAGIAFAVARDVAKKEQPDRPGLLVNTMLVVSLAFAMLGLAGLANKFSDKWGMIPGIILGTFGRFVCAFLSGMIFFGMYAPEGQNLVVYSIVYNGLYLVPEAIICIVLALIPQIRQLAKRLALQD